MIPKKGKNLQDPNNHRPISLLEVIAKTFEKILKIRFMAKLEEILPTTQSGFRSSRSTIDPLIKLTTSITNAFNRSMCCLAIFLDIEKAFDKVWHNGLLYKLHTYNFSPQFIKLIQSFITERVSKVKIKNSFSLPFSPLSGTPQGSVLSPALYLFFSSDLPQPINQKSFLAQFADDTAYWVTAYSTRTASRILQQQINRLENWFKKWRILPNPNKTQLILFRHRHLSRRSTQQIKSIKIKVWNLRIHLCNTATYLGIIFNKTLNWTSTLRHVITTARKRFNLLIRLRGKLRGCHPRTLLHTYKTFIRPILDYPSCITAIMPNHMQQRMFQMERRFTRRIFRMPPETENKEVYNRAKLIPLQSRHSSLRARYVKRTINQPLRTDMLQFLSTPAAPHQTFPSHKYPHLPSTLSLFSRIESPDIKTPIATPIHPIYLIPDYLYNLNS